MKDFHPTSGFYTGFHRPKEPPLWRRAVTAFLMYGSAAFVGIGTAWILIRGLPW